MNKFKIIIVLFAIVFAINRNLIAAEKHLQIESVHTTDAFKKEYGTKLYNFLLDRVMPRKAKFDPKAKGALNRLLANRSGKFVEYMKDFEEDKYITNFVKEYLKFIKLDAKGYIWTGNIKSKIINSGSYTLQKSVDLASDIRVIQNGEEKLNVPTMRLNGVFSKDAKNKKKEILKGKIRFQLAAIIPVMIDDLGNEMIQQEKDDLASLLHSLTADLEVLYKVTE